jgi:serine phosphatase RsbU (regulator of sigma subunit)
LLFHHHDPARNAFFASQLERTPISPAELSGIGEVLRTGEAQWFPSARPGLFLERFGFGSAAVIPLEARGRVIGGLALANDAGRPMAEAEYLLARELAVRGGLTLDRARLFAERSLVAETLQSSLLPPTLPSIPGIDLGAAYVAAGSEVGGDFYDAFSIDDSRWLVTIGDVRGKGIAAAELTSLARHTIRSSAITGETPSGMLRHLNEMLLRSHKAGDFEPRFCTVALAVLTALPDGAGYSLTVCSGGHPLPVRWSADGHLTELGRAGTVMGVVPDVELHEVTYPLTAGDVVVMFTDGVSERRSGPDFFDTIGLVGALDAAGPAARATAVAEHVQAAVRGFGDAPLNDDMAVLVLKTCTG